MILVLWMLAGCHNGGWCDSGCWLDTGPRGTSTPADPTFFIVWADDGALPEDTDGDGVADVGCGDTLTVEVYDSQKGTWTLGMLDADLPWDREACLNGDGDCHHFGPGSQAHHTQTEIRQACDPDAFQADRDTLFHAGIANEVGYLLRSGDRCYLFGRVPDAYAQLGCAYVDEVEVVNARDLGFYARFQWQDNGEVPHDTDGDGIPDAGCGDRLQIEIGDPLGVQDWSLGLHHLISNAEDCLTDVGGEGPFCHDVHNGLSRLNETAGCDRTLVTPGGVTAHHAGQAPGLTYYLSDGRDCFTQGPDPAYYATLGCRVL